MGDLFAIRNQLYIGNYQQVVTDASTFNSRGDLQAKLECETLLHRAYVAMNNHFLVLQKIRDDDPVSLQAVKLLATYMQSPNQFDNVCERLNSFKDDPATASDPTMLVIAAMICHHEGQFETALKYVHDPKSHLEMMATLVYTYLQMDRVDLAEKHFKTMQQTSDDATLTQLASAWVNLAKGGDKIQEALYIFTELAEKFGSTVSLLNGMAACHMSQGEFAGAEKLLQEALSKNPNDVDSLINTIVCLQHLQTSEERQMTIKSQLFQLHPSHPWVKKVAKLEENLARVA
jgi:coatomer protein complex subunit epsilon